MTNNKLNNPLITIGWLYPELFNIYGDRGNIMILQARGALRNIDIKIKKICLKDDAPKTSDIDLLFMGGAQDAQQSIAYKDFLFRRKFIKAVIEKGAPGLFICGAYQLLGKYYITAQNETIKGLGIIDLYTKNPGTNQKRLIGNVRLEPAIKEIKNNLILGFENHGGRTHLGKNIKPFGKVMSGFGNNAEDSGEGVLYKNTIGTYLHGPILSINPALSDWLISKAMEVKYQKKFNLSKIDDTYELQAREMLMKRKGIKV